MMNNIDILNKDNSSGEQGIPKDIYMDRYAFCIDANCEKFKAAEKKALSENNSVIDAASDMWEFVDSCCNACVEFQKAIFEGKIKGE